MPIEPVNVLNVASRLDQPLQLLPLARVEDYTAMVFLCRGIVTWHRHEEQDELFFVQTGEIILENRHQKLTLKPGQLSVVPRQVNHRSRAEVSSFVVLFERTTPLIARNGHRRVFVSGVEAPLAQVDLSTTVRTLTGPFQPWLVASVNDFDVWLLLVTGESPCWNHSMHDVLVFVLEGQVTLEAGEDEHLRLGPGDLAVIPRHTPHRLDALTRAYVLLFGDNHIELRTPSS